MKRLRWLVIRALDQFGWLGMAGAFILIPAVSYQFIQLSRPDAIALAVDSGRRAVSPSTTLHGEVRAELEALDKMLKTASLEENLQALQDAGRAAGIELKRLDYRMADDKGSRLRQYQIMAPITGSYPRVREFIGIALEKIPALALDHVSFQKRKLQDPSVDAELRFTLFIPDVP